MAEWDISLLFDIIIILLLGLTIFYAARLSVSLKTFRNSRSEFEKLLTELSNNIIRAEDAIKSMKETAGSSGEELQHLINKSKGLSQELQLMTEIGNSLAERLEKTSQTARKKAPNDYKRRQNFEENEQIDFIKPKDSENNVDDMFTGFNIKDPEFEYDIDEEMEWDEMEDLQSDAEKELFRALKQKEKY